MLLIRKYMLAICLCLLVSSPALAYEAKVVGVTDGDTIKVLKDNRTVKIRLHGLDCPEKKQAFGTKAKQYTSEMVYGKTVEVNATDKDRYGRTVAWVYVDGQNLNLALVKAGLAWHYKRYSSDQALAEAEVEARKGKVGLWSDPHAIPPWEFRRSKAQQKHSCVFTQ